jgi:hypothetical protein
MKNDWILDELKITFKKGYDFENSSDRYEGKISFKNGQSESFSFHLPPGMAGEYIKLCSADIVKAANNLGNKLIGSLGFDGANNNVQS